MNKIYPLSLSAYYLNFSYPGQLNLETRVFVSIPFASQSMEKNQKMEFVELCFEMNSAFNKHKANIEENSVDPGLKVMMGINQIDIPGKNIKKYFEEKMKEDGVTCKKNYFFNSEEDLYNNMKSSVSNFLLDSYEKNWINFTKNSREKYLKGSLSIYPSELEKDENVYLKKELLKIDKFVEEVQKVINILLGAKKVDEKLLKQLNVSLVSNGGGISSQILASTPLTDRDEVIELNKLIKTFNYYTLSKELPKQDSSRPKIKKV